MIDPSELNKFLSKIKDRVQDVHLELGQRLSNDVSTKMQKEWDEYTSSLERLSDEEKKKLLDPKEFGISSLDRINVETIEKFKNGSFTSIITVDRQKDARILEYVYGNKSPLSNTLSKFHNKVVLLKALKDIIKNK